MDDILPEVIDYLFDGYATVSKSSPDSADTHVPKPMTMKQYKRKKREVEFGLANNAFGAAAGAGATTTAYKVARDNYKKATASPAAKKEAAEKLYNKKLKIPFTGSKKAGRAAKAIPYGRALKKLKPHHAIAAAGATAVGSQLVNGGMDAQSGGYFLKERLKMRKPKQNKIKKTLDQKLLYEAIIKDINPVFDDNEDVEWSGEFSKVDTEKRQVFGWCSLNKVNGEEIIDRQGDYIPLDEIEKSAYDYVIHSRKGGDMHKRDGEQPLQTSDLIESFVVTPEKLEQLGLEQDAVPHGWWVGFKVNDDDQWEAVKKGDRRHFSIHGKGKRVEKRMR